MMFVAMENNRARAEHEADVSRFALRDGHLSPHEARCRERGLEARESSGKTIKRVSQPQGRI